MGEKDIIEKVIRSTSIISKVVEPTAEIVGEYTGNLIDLVLGKVFVGDKIKEFKIRRDLQIQKLKLETEEELNKIKPKDFIDIDYETSEKIAKILYESKYSLSNDEIRKMFSKLIAKSLDKNYSDKSKTYYSSIISELTTSDAILLKHLVSLDQKIIIYLSEESQANTLSPEENEESLNNLMRLMIVNKRIYSFDDGQFSYKGNIYSDSGKIFFAPYKDEFVEVNDDLRIEYVIELTELGKNFCELVL